MYTIVFSAKARKALRKYRKSGSFPREKFATALLHLRNDTPLPPSLDDHQLKGDLYAFRELHLAYDVLIRYKRNEGTKVVTISQIGTHAELFGS